MKRSDIKPLPDSETLRRLFAYDPDTGALTWKAKPHPNARRVSIGAQVGTISEKGYRVVGIGRSYYLVHRIIWKMMTGTDPHDQIDHEDTDRLNNRWKNLRPTENGKNIQNSRLRSDNSSGIKGVAWDASHRKWRAVITADMKPYRIGRFETLAQARSAITEARTKLHGKFARAS